MSDIRGDCDELMTLFREFIELGGHPARFSIADFCFLRSTISRQLGHLAASPFTSPRRTRWNCAPRSEMGWWTGKSGRDRIEAEARHDHAGWAEAWLRAMRPAERQLAEPLLQIMPDYRYDYSSFPKIEPTPAPGLPSK